MNNHKKKLEKKIGTKSPNSNSNVRPTSVNKEYVFWKQVDIMSTFTWPADPACPQKELWA